jgi:WD40 repeat protein
MVNVLKAKDQCVGFALWFVIASISWTCSGAAVLAQPGSSPAGGYKTEEVLLGPIYWYSMANQAPFDVVTSADGRHVAYDTRIECEKKSMCVYVDGKRVAVTEDTVGMSVALSPDGAHIAYVAARKGKAWVMLDGHEASPEYKGDGFLTGPTSLVFSPDGQHLAYVAATEGPGHSHQVVLDGKGGEGYDGIQSLIFSPDGKRKAFAARTGKKWSVVVDGQAGFAYDQVVGPAFSPDGGSVIYAARQDKAWTMVVNGQAGAAYSYLPGEALIGEQVIGNKDLIPAHWSTVSRPSNSTAVLLNTGYMGPIGFQYLNTVAFSGDGKHLAYTATWGSKWLVVRDGQNGQEYEKIGIGSPALSPDGKHLAYSVKTCCFTKEGPWKMSLDGQEGEGFDKMFNPSFSPDGKHLAYAIEKPEFGKMKDWAVVEDGQVGERGAAVGNWAFSPDSRHFAYAAKTREGFSTDDPWGGGGWQVFLDGKAGDEYTVIIPNTMVFDSDGTLEFLAIRKEGHSLVECRGSLYRVKYAPGRQ